MNARLADVCIGTSAAPTVLPAHYFETVDRRTGASRSFNVIDGGLAANNPVLIYCLLGYSSFFSFSGWVLTTSMKSCAYFLMI
jgi:patatin-like phospholipase/acyl hydrolase